MAKSKSVRERVYNKFEGRCAYCGKPIEYKQMQVDHYYPKCKAKFYARRCKIDVHAEDNLMPTCRRCNHYKRAATPKPFCTMVLGMPSTNCSMWRILFISLVMWRNNKTTIKNTITKGRSPTSL